VTADYAIMRGGPQHVRAIPVIERAAGERFTEIGMADVADGEVTPVPIVEERAEHGRLYVALARDEAVAGFLIWSPKDDLAFIEEVSVHPAHAGHRLAARLIDRLAADARGAHSALSLTTFRDVPWNAPYYAKLGFVELARESVGPDHEESWRHQAQNGLDMSRRLFMTRPINPRT